MNWKIKLNAHLIFVISSVVVNAANYGFNLLLGRWLGPAAYADAVFYTTFALAFSFVALMFQMTTTRYVALFNENADSQRNISTFLNQLSIRFGLVCTLLLCLLAIPLQSIFHTESALSFCLLGLSLPFYFLMSVGRGAAQGNLNFNKLTVTYQIELWAKIAIAIGLITIGMGAMGILIAIVASFFATFLYTYSSSATAQKHLDTKLRKEIMVFFSSVGIYELSQILINNSDVFLAKTFLTPSLAGQYAALAMIGRIVFFSSFPIIMILVPMLVQKHQRNEPYQQLLYGSVAFCAFIITFIVGACYFYSDSIMLFLFGKDFVSVAPFLWQYALATGVFTVCNIFIYYHLSLHQKASVLFSIFAGCVQIALIFFQHSDIQQFIYAQWIAMSFLFIGVIGLHFVESRKKRVA